MSDFRYTYEPYKTPANKHTCPACNKPKKFVRYVDTVTGYLLPSHYGKCDRLNNCGYELNPYKDGYSKNKWIEERDQNKVFVPAAKVPAKKIVNIPFEILNGSLSGYDKNSFAIYLKDLLGAQKANELIARFYIGTSNYWNGATVFWLIDNNFKIKGGQVILYDNNGSTYKKELPDGSVKRHNTWVHSALKYSINKKGQQLPQWLKDYEHCQKSPIPFGLHQLKSEPKNKPIAIVESAKTAIIATAYLPQFIWMGIGGLTYLNDNRLIPLSDRSIWLYPDQGGYDEWKKRAKLAYNQNIEVSDLLEKKGKKGSDLADYLIQYDWRDFVKDKNQSNQEKDSMTLSTIDKVDTEIEINEYGYPAMWDNI